MLINIFIYKKSNWIVSGMSYCFCFSLSSCLCLCFCKLIFGIQRTRIDSRPCILHVCPWLNLSFRRVKSKIIVWLSVLKPIQLNRQIPKCHTQLILPIYRTWIVHLNWIDHCTNKRCREIYMNSLRLVWFCEALHNKFMKLKKNWLRNWFSFISCATVLTVIASKRSMTILW